MKIKVIDFETTGPNPEICLPLEVATITYDTDTKRRTDIFSTLIWGGNYPEIPKEITELTGISKDTMAKEGFFSPQVFTSFFSGILSEVDMLCAYNAGFDSVVLKNICKSTDILPPKKPWFCGMVDLPYPQRLMRCRQLQHRALDLGLPMDERKSHRAMADVETMCDIFDLYDMNEVLEYHKIPWVYAAAIVPPPWKDGGVGRDQAKAAGFGWECSPGDSTKFPAKWVSRFKEGSELPKFPFKVEYLS